MTAEQFLQELETLTYTARIHRMVDVGRTAAHDPQLAAILTTLEKGDFYERFLALHSCFGSRDSAHVLRSLTDPSRIIRAVAINLATLACDEQQLRQALAIVPRDGRRSLLWKLHHHGYDALIDEFLEQLAAANDLQLRKILPCGSPALVRQHSARLQSFMGLADWRRLTRHHSAITFELLQAKAEAASNLDLQLVAFVNGVLPLLAQKQPDLAVTLVETLTRSVPLSRLDLACLLLQRPAAIADLALQNTGDLGALDFGNVAHKLDVTRLLTLYATYPAHLERAQGGWWLRRVPPARRAALYAAFSTSWRDQYRHYGSIPTEIVALLPHPLREQEGRRCLELPSLAMYPQERLAYAAFVPWDEALRVLNPFLHDPGEKVRTAALQTLVLIASYERTHLPEVLEIVRTHLHEPDPVCSTTLNSLNELPRGIWRIEHLESMEHIIQGVIDAFDASSATVGALLLLIIRLLECAPEWSAAQFARVAQARGITFQYGCIDNRLSDAEVRQLGPALRPVLTSWAEKGDEETFQALLSVFGKRVHVFEELLDALEVVFNKKISFEFGNQILIALIDHRPARAAQLIPGLIQGDKNWISYPAMLTYLHYRRQDLLTPFLKQQKYSDLFNVINDETSYRRKRRRGSQPLTRGYARWTARQQISFSRTLLKVIGDATNDHQTIARAIARLAALPTVPTSRLTALTKDQRPAVRDTALILLCKLDDATSVLPTLLEALHDERAVRAMYALRPFLLAAPVQQALAILRAVPLTRVTIAKEMIRLLGELPGEEAFQTLLALDSQDLHRDVRVALMRALGRHIERDEAWHILERETGSSDKIIALSTASLSTSPPLAKTYHAHKRFGRRRSHKQTLHPFFWFSEWNTVTLTHLAGEHLAFKAQQRLMRLYALLLARPELDVRVAVLKGCTRLPATDEEQLLLKRLLAAMDTNNEEICTVAASAIFGTSIADDAAVIEQAIGRLLPNRRALQAISLILHQTLTINRQQLIPIVRTIIAALAADPLTIERRINLAIASLPWDEVATMLTEAAATNSLHADALHQACNTLGNVIGRYGSTSRPDNKEMVHLEAKLASSPDERLRRIALAALLAQTEESNDWNAEQRARLEVYRADPAVLVAAAAQFTVIPAAEA